MAGLSIQKHLNLKFNPALITSFQEKSYLLLCCVFEIENSESGE
jgi:hypothetical protein